MVAVLVAFGVAGCGDGGESQAPRAAELTADERRLVTSYEGRIQQHCVRVARSLTDPAAAPSPGERSSAFQAADALAALAASKPTARVDAGQDLRLYLSDVVENLEGSNCDPRMIVRLERALAKIPNR